MGDLYGTLFVFQLCSYNDNPEVQCNTGFLSGFYVRGANEGL